MIYKPKEIQNLISLKIELATCKYADVDIKHFTNEIFAPSYENAIYFRKHRIYGGKPKRGSTLSFNIIIRRPEIVATLRQGSYTTSQVQYELLTRYTDGVNYENV